MARKPVLLNSRLYAFGFRMFSRDHVAKISRGETVTFKGFDVAALTTIGRKSGEPRTVAVAYARDGDTLLTGASAGGREQSPAWYGNLKANPECTIRIGGVELKRIAREVDDEHYADALAKLIAVAPNYGDYADWRGRPFPIMALDPVPESENAGETAAEPATAPESDA
ncbi:nitroreductase/quinone reductase family protein [Microbacterium sp. ASV49]|uniref:Nitroreductase/quinone reductase family protein n=1 Tax=Microbacterium candidum TaxID=3041922 RepID=A0ABT7MVU0_9MICO|nr:nitroreductase/quinone reductase family protein [Microbacterium sp. ASV49]MDL9978575.1 nitroreductase/quinone reductase family protein [Microbacterium sp. ASV49]